MKKLVVIIGVIAALVAPLVVASSVSAQSVDIYGACSGSSGEVCKNRGATVQPLFKNLINAILLILGAIRALRTTLRTLRSDASFMHNGRVLTNIVAGRKARAQQIYDKY